MSIWLLFTFSLTHSADSCLSHRKIDNVSTVFTKYEREMSSLGWTLVGWLDNSSVPVVPFIMVATHRSLHPPP